MTTTSAEPSTSSGSAAAPQRRRQITSYKSTTSSPATDRDGDPRFAPVALAGYTAADTPDPRVSLLRAPRLANLSPFCGCTARYDACATKVIVRGAHAGPRTLGHPPSGCGIDPRFFLNCTGIACRALKRRSAPRAGLAAMPFATKSARSGHSSTRMLQY